MLGLRESIKLSTLGDKFFEFPAMCINKTFNLRFENEDEKYCYMWKEAGENAKKNKRKIWSLGLFI